MSESRKVFDIERQLARRHRRQHWLKVLNVAGLLAFGAVALWAVWSLLGYLAGAVVL
ncbi:MAG: hypothetical protein NUW22_05005 [Acidobacteria bacterium]|nr:hypothetical protein [Acidobacteriota bacterium]